MGRTLFGALALLALVGCATRTGRHVARQPRAELCEACELVGRDDYGGAERLLRGTIDTAEFEAASPSMRLQTIRLLAAVRQTLGRPRDATALHEEALRLCPETPEDDEGEVRAEYGENLASVGRRDESARELSAALRLTPATDRVSRGRILRELASVRLGQADRPGAAAACAEAEDELARAPADAADWKSLSAWEDLARCWSDLAEPARSARVYETAVRRAVAAGDAHRIVRMLRDQGRAFRDAGDVAAAERAWRSALETADASKWTNTDVSALGARLELVETLTAAGRFAESGRLLERVVPDGPPDTAPVRARLFGEAGVVAAARGDHRAAVDFFDRGLELMAQSPGEDRDWVRWARCERDEAASSARGSPSGSR